MVILGGGKDGIERGLSLLGNPTLIKSRCTRSDDGELGVAFGQGCFVCACFQGNSYLLIGLEFLIKTSRLFERT